ncbi:MAG TPA: hypothetical protein VI488_06570 [Candidatus Angelobacter sp.]
MVQALLLPQELRSSLYLDDQPSCNFVVNPPLEQRPRRRGDGALDGVEASQPHARPGEQLAPLLLPPPFGVCLLSVTIANGLALHCRRFALLAIATPLLAASVIGVTLLQRASCNRCPGLIRALHKLCVVCLSITQ